MRLTLMQVHHIHEILNGVMEKKNQFQLLSAYITFITGFII